MEALKSNVPAVGPLLTFTRLHSPLSPHPSLAPFTPFTPVTLTPHSHPSLTSHPSHHIPHSHPSHPFHLESVGYKYPPTSLCSFIIASLYIAFYYLTSTQHPLCCICFPFIHLISPSSTLFHLHPPYFPFIHLISPSSTLFPLHPSYFPFVHFLSPSVPFPCTVRFSRPPRIFSTRNHPLSLANPLPRQTHKDKG